ncbi:LytTR family DNA-binding domain-containing protein [Eubacterium sp. LFL-14]|uniref:Stage 0 sporulation protein A homolog n=1 Tax=Eubacterium album TaxID=2978477 RepID=A0ABT2M2S3_9FIRM|nr:LytTR family DNA-binding domain-containing protein [Eubacterium sp. LFL-14]MCT7399770.1 LytTR family DNA-binding domain-containing protein [Eubacterium sp. LFL-14]
MRILICDDDLEISTQLKDILHCFFNTTSLKLPEITVYNNGKDLLSDCNEKDIIFLDIELPDVSGIYVGNQLKKSNPNIIIFIVTSYSKYLDDAMRFHVFRYLSKPLDKQRIFKNLKDALNLYASSVSKIPIETKNEVYTVLASDIVCIEAHGRKITVHTVDKDYDSIHTMQYWMDTLNMPCFFISHRSYIVNLEYVSKFDHSLIYFSCNKLQAYLTRRKYTQFKDAYLIYLESTR